MKFALSKEALGALPAADGQGVVRVSASVRITGEGECELLEINDTPVGKEVKTDDDNPMPEAPPIGDAPLY